MVEPDSLTMAFLRAHPEEAAREIERLPVPVAAALMSETPARTIAPVAAAMRAQFAAQAVMRLDVGRAVLLLGALSSSQATAILRYLPAASRREVLDALPGRLALACRALMRFPADSVGTCMDMTAPVLGEWTQAGEALEAVRAAPEAHEGILVVDEGQRLVGWARAADLLRAEAALRLKVLAGPIAALPALMPVSAALEQLVLEDAPVAAVVEDDRRLLGTVTAAALRRAHGARSVPPTRESTSALAYIAAQYWRAVAGLADTAAGAIVASGRRES